MTAFDFETFKGLPENDRTAYICGVSEFSDADCESIVEFLMKPFHNYGCTVIYEKTQGDRENIDFTDSVWMPLVELFKKDPAKLFMACRRKCLDVEHQDAFNNYGDLSCDCIYKTIIEVSDPNTRIINELDFQLSRMVSRFEKYSVDFDFIQRRIDEIDEFIAFRDEFFDKHQDVEFPHRVIENTRIIVDTNKAYYERIMSLRGPIQDFITRFEQITGAKKGFSRFYTFAVSGFYEDRADRDYEKVVNRTGRYMQFLEYRTSVICKDNDTAKSLCGLMVEITEFYTKSIGVKE